MARTGLRAFIALTALVCGVFFSSHSVAQQWYTESQQSLEKMLEKMLALKDFKKSEKEFVADFDRLWKRVTPLAEQGDPLAQFFLARTFNAAQWSGYEAVSDKKSDALKWARSAAEQDFPPAYAMVIEMDALYAKAGACALEPLDYAPKNQYCTQLHALISKAAHAGLSDMMSAHAGKAERKGEIQQTIFTRLYVWTRLELAFSPSIEELKRMNDRFATVRDELIDNRRAVEQKLEAVKGELTVFLKNPEGHRVEQDYAAKEKLIEAALLKWSSRYPALEYGAHGWYRFEK